MSAARHRGSASPLIQGDIQDPSISSTVLQVPIPTPAITRVIITDTGFRSALSTYPFFINSVILSIFYFY